MGRVERFAGDAEAGRGDSVQMLEGHEVGLGREVEETGSFLRCLLFEERGFNKAVQKDGIDKLTGTCRGCSYLNDMIQYSFEESTKHHLVRICRLLAEEQ
jgi:hypothetical protein